MQDRRQSKPSPAIRSMAGRSPSWACMMAYSGDWQHGCAMVERAAQLNPRHPGSYWFPPLLERIPKGRLLGALAAVVAEDSTCRTSIYSHIVTGGGLWATGQTTRRRRDAVARLLTIRPISATSDVDDLEKWYPPELVEHLIDGLRKAGLERATRLEIAHRWPH